MAKKDTTENVSAATAETNTAKNNAVTYTADEFAKAAASVFGEGTSPDIVRAAFKVNGLTSATVDEAKKLVHAFAKKEVVE